ncbi:MAG: O-antigen ligase family protein [Bryobacteraceae bacterium]
MGFALTLLYVALTLLSVAEAMPTLAPYRVQLVIAIITTLASLVSVMVSHRPIFNTQMFLWFGVVGTVLFSRLAQGWLGGIPLAFADFLPSAMLYVFLFINVSTELRLKLTRLVLIFVGLYLAGNGISAYYHDLESPYIMKQAIHPIVTPEVQYLYRVRALGFLEDPNDFSQFLLFLLPLIFHNWKRKSWTVKMLFTLPAAGVVLYTMYLTRSRGALVGLAAIVAFAIKLRMNTVLAAIASVATVVVLIGLNFAGGRALSLGGGADRISIWSDGLGMFKRSPLWGVGYNAYADNAGGMTAHNSYLLALSETGLLGYFFWLGMVVTAVHQIQAMLENTPKDSPSYPWVTTVRLCLYGFLVTSFFLSRTYDSPTYLVLGLVAAVASLHPEGLLPHPMWAITTAGLALGTVVFLYAVVRIG